MDEKNILEAIDYEAARFGVEITPQQKENMTSALADPNEAPFPKTLDQQQVRIAQTLWENFPDMTQARILQRLAHCPNCGVPDCIFNPDGFCLRPLLRLQKGVVRGERDRIPKSQREKVCYGQVRPAQAAAPKLTIIVSRKEGENECRTLTVIDNRTTTAWTDEQIKERGIETFLNQQEMIITLLWNLNASDVKWTQWRKSTNQAHTKEAVGYIFE